MSYVALGMYSMKSVERIHSYLQRVPRERRKGLPLSKEWPERGDIEFKNLSFTYAPGLPPALDDVSFKLPHASKVGIVGRTGSGKSTLLVALFRLIESQSGEIIIGGRSISSLNIDALRTRLSIIPQVTRPLRVSHRVFETIRFFSRCRWQDPMMFSGTLKENVDPLCLYPEQAVRSALQQVGLGDFELNSIVDVILKPQTPKRGVCVLNLPEIPTSGVRQQFQSWSKTIGIIYIFMCTHLCIVLYCIVLYCIVLYCIALHCIAEHRMQSMYHLARDLGICTRSTTTSKPKPRCKRFRAMQRDQHGRAAVHCTASDSCSTSLIARP